MSGNGGGGSVVAAPSHAFLEGGPRWRAGVVNGGEKFEFDGSVVGDDGGVAAGRDGFAGVVEAVPVVGDFFAGARVLRDEVADTHAFGVVNGDGDLARGRAGGCGRGGWKGVGDCDGAGGVEIEERGEALLLEEVMLSLPAGAMVAEPHWPRARNMKVRLAAGVLTPSARRCLALDSGISPGGVLAAHMVSQPRTNASPGASGLPPSRR